MSIRIIKNYTDQDRVLTDLGDITIPKNGAIDIGGDESRLIQLACSENLLTILSEGINKFQLNNGARDLGFSDGLDLIRRVSQVSETDPQGRWLIRTESRRTGYDATFSGAGDDMANKIIGGGVPFIWDFSDNTNLVTAPAGFKRKRIDWHFMDMIYPKEGKVCYHNAPKGSYIDMFLVCPSMMPYAIKTIDSNGNVIRSYRIATKETPFMNWICKYWVEGSSNSYDTLTTEGSTDYPALSYLIWRTEITSPDIPELSDFHGSWILESYRPRSIYIA